MRDFTGAIIGTLFALLIMSFISAIGYCLVGTYNERKECQQLGIPLYRCSANSIKADVKVGQ